MMVSFGFGLRKSLQIDEENRMTNFPRFEPYAPLLFSLSPFLRGEGWGEGPLSMTRLVERAPHPTLRVDLSPQEQGEVKISRAAAAWCSPSAGPARPTSAHAPRSGAASARR